MLTGSAKIRTRPEGPGTERARAWPSAHRPPPWSPGVQRAFKTFGKNSTEVSSITTKQLTSRTEKLTATLERNTSYEIEAQIFQSAASCSSWAEGHGGGPPRTSATPCPLWTARQPGTTAVAGERREPSEPAGWLINAGEHERAVRS